MNEVMKMRGAFRPKWALLAISVAALVITGALLMAEKPGVGQEIIISVSGLVEHPITLDLADLKSRPSVTVTAELICVSGISSGVHDWTGVKLKELLAEVGVHPEAIKVAFTASDHFTTDLTIDDAMGDDVIVAYLEDGSPFSEKTRLVVPGKWGYKWISDIISIELVDYDFMGKWERRGYPDDASIIG